MKVRAIDSVGDFTFGKGKQSYKQDQNAIMQNIKTRLLSVFNNCFFDYEAGLDWFALLGKKGTETEIKLSVRRVISGTDGVIKVNDLSITESDRTLTLSYSVDTVFTINASGLTEVGQYA